MLRYTVILIITVRYFLNCGLINARKAKGKKLREQIANIANEDFLLNPGNKIGKIVRVSRIKTNK
jgi:hypothetical protein